MIYIGTAGYSYKDWIGPFYPEGIKSNSMLEYYSRFFDFTELNSTFYHMPSVRLFDSLNNKTPDNFKFVVKLYEGFTHKRNLTRTEAEKFTYSINPIIESKKFICLLVQLPYSFHYRQENIDYLKLLRTWFEGVDLCVEFRNINWIRKDVIELLKKENMGFVCVDEPKIKGLIGTTLAVTSKISYIRMHGRNKEKWYSNEGSERYNYLYSKEELSEWLPRIHQVKNYSDITIIDFNNHPIGRAIQNARELKELLQIP
jgi:uncharacterized protein YecE (DUF72 family)